jgi:anti-sigma factor ChrR (cupin superfamily)
VLVRWHEDEKFQRHAHLSIEESYVVSAEFIDEYGRYPAGTWIRISHLSEHNLYVEQDTLIWVKVGHLS